MNRTDDSPAAAPDDWLPIPNPADHGTLFPLEEAQLGNLVLEARQIPCQSVADAEGWQLLVPPEAFEAAKVELELYEAENRNWPPPPPSPAGGADNLLTTLAILALLGIFHNLIRLEGILPGLPVIDWVEGGNAAAGAIRAGEWWRTVTALTLHADGLHLLGNLVVGSLFVIPLCRATGSGLGWLLLLLAGALGNLLNAWVQDPLHRSVGASTAIFAAVGLIVVIDHQMRRQQRRGLWLSLAAALALLALLGSEGEQTDLGAHLFGFAAGLLLGLPSSRFLARRGRPASWLDALFGLAALALIGGAWWVALRFS